MEYFSQSAGGWIPAVVKGFSKSSGTYVLDIQPVALPNKVRAVGADANARDQREYEVGSRKLVEMSDQELWQIACTQIRRQSAGTELVQAQLSSQAEPIWRRMRKERDAQKVEQPTASAMVETIATVADPAVNVPAAAIVPTPTPAVDAAAEAPVQTIITVVDPDSAARAGGVEPPPKRLEAQPMKLGQRLWAARSVPQPAGRAPALGSLAESGQPNLDSRICESLAVQAPPSPLRRVPPSGRSLGRTVPASGHLGAALGVPCVVCFGEEGHLKTLHCQYKCHVSCLKQFWSTNVVTLGRVSNIHCPAQVTGCSEYLTKGDLCGVVSPEDLSNAERQLNDVDEQNKQLIDDLKQQSEALRPMFRCSICLIEHEVDDCCTLPCQHRFCFESLQYHFEIIVKERRLNKLCCPEEGCDFNLRSEEHTHMFQQVLSAESYHKLLEFLTRDDPHVYECKHLGCEEHVFLDDNDDFANLQCARGHRFCAKCDNGPHRGMSCEARQEQLDRSQKRETESKHDDQAWRNALAMGWKPCPKRCTFGGGFKDEGECDHVTCECGYEFCWACGVCRQVVLEHDNRWHKPSCPYHTKPSDVKERPKRRPNCPECQKMPGSQPCQFPADDGYPESFIKGRSSRHPKKPSTPSKTPATPSRPAAKAPVDCRNDAVLLKLAFHDFRDDSVRTMVFDRCPLGIQWSEDQMPITINSVTPHSEAQRAGVMKGWWIMSVNDVNLLAHPYEKAAEILCEAVDRLPGM